MGYHVIDPDDLEEAPGRPCEMHYVSDVAGLDHLGLRTYRVDPGEEIPVSGMHYHDEQEEAFYVLEGTLSVETPETTYEVAAGQFFIAEPGNAHRAHNASERPIEVIGIGAPAQADGHEYEK